MKSPIHLPLRLKILVALLFVVTAIVSVITFTMATMFHDDKSTYVTDLVSIAVISAAEETHAVLDGYGSRLQSAGRALSDDGLPPAMKRRLLNGFFSDFPELVGVAIHANGHALTTAIDGAKTADSGVSQQQLEALLAQVPDKPGAGGDGVVITNVSPSAKLPCLLMRLPLTSAADGGSVSMISALVRPDGLLPIATRSSYLDVVIADASGILLAHRDPSRVAERKPLGFAVSSDVSRDSLGTAVTKLMDVAGESLIAGSASARIGGVTVTATLPAATAFLASRDLLRRLMMVTLVLLVIAALAGATWARRITGPVERLSAATGEIAKGRFDARVPVESTDEIGRLGASFNVMATELKNRDAALQGAQEQLVQSEKMAAFGVLGAGIAHEVKNPLAGILGCAQISLRQAQPGTPIHTNLALIEKETKRCKTIIENLLRFARQEKAVMEVFDVTRPLEDAMSIVHHQLELQQVKLESSLTADLPSIHGSANQLQQVFMNLLINAQQAMGPEGGMVSVSTGRRGAGHVEVIVRDTGAGIPKDIQKRIFDPFFTTKPNGTGTGLGLSVTYGIIKDHHGEILLESAPGQGTTFTIVLPIAETGTNSATKRELAAVEA